MRSRSAEVRELPKTIVFDCFQTRLLLISCAAWTEAVKPHAACQLIPDDVLLGYRCGHPVFPNFSSPAAKIPRLQPSRITEFGCQVVAVQSWVFIPQHANLCFESPQVNEKADSGNGSWGHGSGEGGFCALVWLALSTRWH